MSPQEALDAIAALPADVNPDGTAYLSAHDVADILDSVRPEGWNALMRRFSETYPEWMFPGGYTDADWGNGPQVVTLLRVIDGLKKQLGGRFLMDVWVMVPTNTGQVFVYDNEDAARADSTSFEEVRRIHVAHEAVTR